MEWTRFYVCRAQFGLCTDRFVCGRLARCALRLWCAIPSGNNCKCHLCAAAFCNSATQTLVFSAQNVVSVNHRVSNLISICISFKHRRRGNDAFLPQHALHYGPLYSRIEYVDCKQTSISTRRRNRVLEKYRHTTIHIVYADINYLSSDTFTRYLCSHVG